MCSGWRARLLGVVTDQCNDHAVEVEEEHEKMEAQLDEGFLYAKDVSDLLPGMMQRGGVRYLLVDVQLPENLGRIQQVRVLDNPEVWRQFYVRHVRGSGHPYFLMFHARRGRFRIRATQYPLMRKRKVRNPWTAASGMM